MSDCFKVYAPQASTVQAFATASSTALSLSGASVVWMKATQDAQVRFGTSAVAAVTAGDIYLTAGRDYELPVRPGVTHYRVRRLTANGNLFWTRAD